MLTWDANTPLPMVPHRSWVPGQDGDTILETTPIFSGSNNPTHELRILLHQTRNGKSKMEATKREVLISDRLTDVLTYLRVLSFTYLLTYLMYIIKLYCVT